MCGVIGLVYENTARRPRDGRRRAAADPRVPRLRLHRRPRSRATTSTCACARAWARPRSWCTSSASCTRRDASSAARCAGPPSARSPTRTRSRTSSAARRSSTARTTATSPTATSSRQWLRSEGHAVLSDNDGEMVVHTIEHYLRQWSCRRGRSRRGWSASRGAPRCAPPSCAPPQRLEGSYAAVIVDPVTHVLWAIKQGSSLYFGLGQGRRRRPLRDRVVRPVGGAQAHARAGAAGRGRVHRVRPDRLPAFSRRRSHRRHAGGQAQLPGRRGPRPRAGAQPPARQGRRAVAALLHLHGPGDRQPGGDLPQRGHALPRRHRGAPPAHAGPGGAPGRRDRRAGRAARPLARPGERRRAGQRLPRARRRAAVPRAPGRRVARAQGPRHRRAARGAGRAARLVRGRPARRPPAAGAATTTIGSRCGCSTCCSSKRRCASSAPRWAGSCDRCMASLARGRAHLRGLLRLELSRGQGGQPVLQRAGPRAAAPGAAGRVPRRAVALAARRRPPRRGQPERRDEGPRSMCSTTSSRAAAASRASRWSTTSTRRWRRRRATSSSRCAAGRRSRSRRRRASSTRWRSSTASRSSSPSAASRPAGPTARTASRARDLDRRREHLASLPALIRETFEATDGAGRARGAAALPVPQHPPAGDAHDRGGHGGRAQDPRDCAQPRRGDSRARSSSTAPTPSSASTRCSARSRCRRCSRRLGRTAGDLAAQRHAPGPRPGVGAAPGPGRHRRRLRPAPHALRPRRRGARAAGRRGRAGASDRVALPGLPARLHHRPGRARRGAHRLADQHPQDPRRDDA